MHDHVSTEKVKISEVFKEDHSEYTKTMGKKKFVIQKDKNQIVPINSPKDEQVLISPQIKPKIQI